MFSISYGPQSFHKHTKSCIDDVDVEEKLAKGKMAQKENRDRRDMRGNILDIFFNEKLTLLMNKNCFVTLV